MAKAKLYSIRAAKDLERVLTAAKLNFFSAPQSRGKYLLPFRTKTNDVIHLYVEYMPTQKSIYFAVFNLFNINSAAIPNAEQRELLYRWMMNQNLTRVLGGFGRDDNDGEVRAQATFPLDRGGIAIAQLIRYVQSVVNAASDFMDKMRKDTGTPVRESADNIPKPATPN